MNHPASRAAFVRLLTGLVLCSTILHAGAGLAAAAESRPLWRQVVIGVPTEVAGTIFRSTLEGEPRAMLAWGAIGASFLLDEKVRDAWRDNVKSSALDDAAGVLYDTGTPKFGAAFIGGGLLASWALEERELSRTFLMAAESALLSQVAAETLKSVTGRVRPEDSGGDASRWGERGSHSFVSGHASGAWSVATVFARRHPGSRLIPALAYGWATSVSASRIHDDGHWLSDVVVGGLLGYLIGRTVVDSHTRRAGERWQITPVLQSDGMAVQLARRF